MKRFKYLALAALVAAAACSDSGTNTTVTGTITGTVTVAGTGAAGITVTLSSGASTTTDGSGGYTFSNVAAGAYTVTVSDYPSDVTFSSTSKAATISAASATVNVNFSGDYVMTSSISGSVTAAGTGLAGVAVALSGPGGNKSGVTDAAGNFAFNGLRAGDYTVTISNIPSGYTFATTSATVTVGVGEAKSAPFVGTKDAAEVTANVAIKSITNLAGLPVNTANVAGQINVTVTVDPGNNLLSQVCLLVDTDEVGCQTLGAGAPGVDGPQAVGALDLLFTYLTDDTEADGTPKKLNGAHTLSARADLVGATQSNVKASQVLTFNNADKVSLAWETGTGPVIGEDALSWGGGALTITGMPSMYSGGEIASMSLCAKQNSATGTPAAGTTKCMAATSSPFTVTIPKSGGTTNLSGWSSQNVTVTASSVTTGGSNGPSAASSSFRLDEVAPTATVALPTSVTNNYLGMNFGFSAGTDVAKNTATAVTDPGAAGEFAGLATVTYYAATTADAGADTPANNQAIVDGNDPITDVTGLESTITNAAYVLVVKVTDVTGNYTIYRNASNFGVDLVAPTFTVDAGSTPDKAINPTTSVSLSVADDYSGFGPTPMQLQVVKKTIVSGATKTECVDPADGVIGNAGDVVTAVPTSGSCAFVSQGATGFSFDPAQTNNAYYDVTFQLADQAGNISTAGTRSALLDNTNPTVSVNSFAIASNTVTVSGPATDNLDIGSWNFRLFYDNAGYNLTFTDATAVSDFGEPLVGSASPSGSASIIRGYKDQVGGAVHNLAGAGFGVFDVAGNYGENSYATAAAFVGITTDVTDFTVDNPAICLTGAGSTACGTTATSVTVHAKVTTVPDVANPFTAVWFYAEDTSGVLHPIGKATSASLQTLTGPDRREWTWSMTLSSDMLPPDITTTTDVVIHAVALEADTDALHAMSAALDVK